MPPHSKVAEKRSVPLPTQGSPDRQPPPPTRNKKDVVPSSASDNSLVQTSPPPSSPPSLPLPTGRQFNSAACLCGRNASYAASNSQLACADVQRSYFNDDPEHLLYGYISLPLGKSLEQAHRRTLWLKHLKVVLPSSGSSRFYIARHHFPPRAFNGHQYSPRVSTGGPYPYLECDDSERVSCSSPCCTLKTGVSTLSRLRSCSKLFLCSSSCSPSSPLSFPLKCLEDNLGALPCLAVRRSAREGSLRCRHKKFRPFAS